MGNGPILGGGVAEEASFHVVVHAARGHPVQRVEHDVLQLLLARRQVAVDQQIEGESAPFDVRSLVRRSASSAIFVSNSSRRSVQAEDTCRRRLRMVSGGKYVPPVRISPVGVRKAVEGQPPML